MNGTGLSFSTPVHSTGKFCAIRSWKFQEIHTGIFGRMVSTQSNSLVCNFVNVKINELVT